MDPIGLRELIARGETANCEFKASMKWEGDARAKLAKTIAAMANTRDGGVLIIGVRDSRAGGQATLGGLSNEELATFDTTLIAQYVNSKFEPAVRLHAEKHTVDGHTLAVIVVAEFEAEPVVCTREGTYEGNRQFKPSDILVRTAAAESAPASPAEIRELLNRSVSKKGDHLLDQMRRIVMSAPPPSRRRRPKASPPASPPLPPTTSPGAPSVQRHGGRTGYFTFAVFEDHATTDFNARYQVVRWHMLDTDDWALDNADAIECRFPYFHMVAAILPPSAMSLASSKLDATVHPKDQGPLRLMPGYLASWMVKATELEGYDPQATMNGWCRGTEDSDIQQFANPKAMYLFALWVEESGNGDGLCGYTVARGKVLPAGREPEFKTWGSWYLHEAIGWLPPPTLMRTEWQMQVVKVGGQFKCMASKDGPIAVWYAPQEVVEAYEPATPTSA